MSTQTVKLLDTSGHVVAIAYVADEGDRYGGTIDLRSTPPRVRELFDEFEEIVNGQMLSYLDEVQDKIAALSIRAVFPGGAEAEVRDLQVFPATGGVSFKLASVPIQNGRPA